MNLRLIPFKYLQRTFCSKVTNKIKGDFTFSYNTDKTNADKTKKPEYKSPSFKKVVKRRIIDEYQKEDYKTLLLNPPAAQKQQQVEEDIVFGYNFPPTFVFDKCSMGERYYIPKNPSASKEIDIKLKYLPEFCLPFDLTSFGNIESDINRLEKKIIEFFQITPTCNILEEDPTAKITD